MIPQDTKRARSRYARGFRCVHDATLFAPLESAALSQNASPTSRQLSCELDSQGEAWSVISEARDGSRPTDLVFSCLDHELPSSASAVVHLEQHQPIGAWASPHEPAGSRHRNRPIPREQAPFPPAACVQQTDPGRRCSPASNSCWWRGAQGRFVANQERWAAAQAKAMDWGRSETTERPRKSCRMETARFKEIKVRPPPHCSPGA